jgi:hypothetical protein
VPYSRALGSFLGGTESAPLPHTRTVAVVATTLASILSRVSSLVSQVIVGLFLTESEVGVWALAVGVAGITAIWRNGGAATYLPSMRPNEFEEQLPKFMTWAIACNLATALLTALAASNESALRWATSGSASPEALGSLQLVLWVLSARAAIAPVALAGRMRLTVRQQFAMLARLDATIAIARVAATWVVAREGGGALSLAVPFSLGTVIEIAAFTSLGAISRHDFRPRTAHLQATWRVLRWPLAIAIVTSLRTEAFFLALGWLVPTGVLGIFYFAFQLANQPTMTLGGPLQSVFAPITAQTRGDPKRERANVERVLAGAMLFVPITTMAAASHFPAAERFLWNGKWAAAGPGIYLLCIAATYSTVAAILSGPLVGLQRFKAAASFDILKLLGAILGVAVAATALQLSRERALWGLQPVTALAAGTALGMTLASLTQIIWVGRTYRVSAADLARHLLFGPTLSALTAVAATSIAKSVDDSLGIPQTRTGALVELLTIFATYASLITLAVRFTAEGTLRDAIGVLPAPAAKVLRQLLVLN